MSTTSRVWTYADLEAMPESERERYGIVDGDLIVTPSPGPYHESLGVEATLLFGYFVKAHRLGRNFGDHVDTILPDGSVVIPDLTFIARDRLGIVGPKAIEGAPDLVLEILSPSTRDRDLGAKMALYARSGIKEYWVLDPKARSITVYALRDGRYESLPQVGGVARSEVLPGLEIDVAALSSSPPPSSSSASGLGTVRPSAASPNRGRVLPACMASTTSAGGAGWYTRRGERRVTRSAPSPSQWPR